jgi:hypothetical protein
MATATISSVQEAFEWFESQVVRIPESEDRAAQEVHPKIRAAMRHALRGILLEDFLSGSYSRRVQVAPKLNDIDIVLTLADATGLFRRSATAALRAIEVAALSCDLVKSTELRCRSVRAHLHDYEFTVDLVAALEPTVGDGVLLARRMPELGLDDWSFGNPKGQRQAAVDKNGICEGMYVRTVRIIKFWKNGACKEFKSYHAESILFHALESALPYDEAIMRFFNAAFDQLAPGVLTEDPGAPGIFVDERLEDRERQPARSAVATAGNHAAAALSANSVEDALEHWAQVFGPSFPAQSRSRDSLAESLAERTAGIAGLGVTAHRGPQTVQPRSWRIRR